MHFIYTIYRMHKLYTCCLCFELSRPFCKQWRSNSATGKRCKSKVFMNAHRFWLLNMQESLKPLWAQRIWVSWNCKTMDMCFILPSITIVHAQNTSTCALYSLAKLPSILLRTALLVVTKQWNTESEICWGLRKCASSWFIKLVFDCCWTFCFSLVAFKG